ncbi:MAG: hypothetical protein EOS10_00265 [Mesorhizobium sp.]|uniref:hypothetical protein n=1 Tax=Mesorhizobium sp. TaxID=1871066 RepID=UPI000FE733FB|nr:hypothetical protein [Mesorhizobium sp.]RWO34772.1 MAG: hypothetical protein EOS10_00265 [Mesorhizobium sp.]
MKTFDSKCLDLAAGFLSDHADRTDDEHDELAQVIQDAIEDWFSDRENRAEAAYERQQQSLMESGGTDDSSYRRDLTNAGRGHLLK